MGAEEPSCITPGWRWKPREKLNCHQTQFSKRILVTFFLQAGKPARLRSQNWVHTQRRWVCGLFGTRVVAVRVRAGWCWKQSGQDPGLQGALARPEDGGSVTRSPSPLGCGKSVPPAPSSCGLSRPPRASPPVAAAPCLRGLHTLSLCV